MLFFSKLPGIIFKNLYGVQIEMHLAMNTHNDNYDTSRGEQIALNVDGEQSRAAVPDRTFTSALMDTQVQGKRYSRCCTYT